MHGRSLEKGTMVLRGTLIGLMLTFPVFSHEPLYGIGPHVLFKGGWAPHLTMDWGENEKEAEMSLGYGITRHWTVIAEAPFGLEDGTHWEGIGIKNKYHLWSRLTPGSSMMVSGVGRYQYQAENGKPDILFLGLTGGQESLFLYWFLSAGYAAKFSDGTQNPGDEVNYSVTLGFRPHPVDYYRPDLVLFAELLGTRRLDFGLSGDAASDGDAWAMAPTFMLTYRNMALRGGYRFGLGSSEGLKTPDAGTKATLEWHL